MAPKSISLGIIFFFALYINPTFAQTAILLSDAELDQYHAGGLNFDFGRALGSLSTTTGRMSNGHVLFMTPSGNIKVTSSPNIKVVSPTAPQNTTAPTLPEATTKPSSPLQTVDPTVPTGVFPVANITNSITPTSTPVAETNPSTSTATPNTLSSLNDNVFNESTPLTETPSITPQSLSTESSTPFLSTNLTELSSFQASGSTGSIESPQISSISSSGDSIPPPPLLEQTTAITQMANAETVPDSSDVSTPTLPVNPTAPMNPTTPNKPAEPVGPSQPQNNEVNIIASTDGTNLEVAVENLSALGESPAEAFNASSLSGQNVLNISELSQQHLKAFVNINAAGSIVPVQVNFVVLMNSTIQNLNNNNTLDIQNITNFQAQ